MDKSPDTSPEKGTAEWLQIAKQAQDMIGKVDLTKVTDHDDPEVQKLNSVVNALESMSNGELVDHVPGLDSSIDDPEEAPSMDPDTVRTSLLLQELDAAGYAGRIGRIFFEGAADPEKPLEFIPHRDGLPDFDICLKPDFSPAKGAAGIFVSNRGVFLSMVPDPVTKHRWRILRSTPYADNKEMLDIVGRFITRRAE